VRIPAGLTARCVLAAAAPCLTPFSPLSGDVDADSPAEIVIGDGVLTGPEDPCSAVQCRIINQSTVACLYVDLDEEHPGRI